MNGLGEPMQSTRIFGGSRGERNPRVLSALLISRESGQNFAPEHMQLPVSSASGQGAQAFRQRCAMRP
jgi:hypothetical protein